MLALLAFSLWGFAERAKGEEVVIIKGVDGGEQSIQGEILDWTGEQLHIQRENGAATQIPVDQIIEVQFPRNDAWQEGDRHRDAAEFAEALECYLRAFREEEKTWIKRQILAEVITCQTELEQWRAAGESFLLLIGSDPSTPFFDRIPLPWAPNSGAPSLDAQALQWIASEEPAAKLLGASMLLSGSYREEAKNILRQLANDADARIAALAQSQWWHSQYISATEIQIASWEERIEQMPSELRAGAYYVVGRAWAQRSHHEEAALSFLHVPLLYPQMRTLSAAALRLAARELEKGDQPEEAAALYHEFIRKYSDSPYLEDVRQRLSLLDESE